MAWETWILYLMLVTGLSLTPGPNSLLALSHGALYGHRKTIYTITGGSVGFVVIIALSMIGIGALLQASPEAFTALKWVGAAYLVWLGIQLWRAPRLNLGSQDSQSNQSARALFHQGFLAALSNPKVLLFFGAFLPQFIEPGIALFPQFFALALTFAFIEFLVEYFLARVAHNIRPLIFHQGKAFNRLCGGLFVLIGAALPMIR